MRDKIKSISEICSLVAEDKSHGESVVHCHGVFDLVHPGHIKHFQEAKKQGQKLVVSLTPDKFVNKGPGRPIFNEALRLEQVAALGCVDYVVLNDSKDAISLIEKIQPNVYVKGKEYEAHEDDVTGKIVDEVATAEKFGGRVYYTDDIVFSSSKLINQNFDSNAARIAPFIQSIKERYSKQDIFEVINSLSQMEVTVLGDAIIDEYQYVSPLGHSAKGQHATAQLLERDVFLGGSLIIANHLANFTKKVTLISAIGEECSHRHLIEQNLSPNIDQQFVHLKNYSTLVKKRYVIKDGDSIQKLFETYSTNCQLLDHTLTEGVIHKLNRTYETELLLVADFGNGFMNTPLIHATATHPAFLAVNTQVNSGNRGYNVITHYRKADFISLNEPELRLAAHDRHSRLEMITEDLAHILSCPYISVTRGTKGMSFYSKNAEMIQIPALVTHAVDRVGAGDSYFALASLCMAKGIEPLLAGFLGSVAAAIDVQIVGNKESIRKETLCKFITRLLK